MVKGEVGKINGQAFRKFPPMKKGGKITMTGRVSDGSCSQYDDADDHYSLLNIVEQ
jgi:hypothetical protein